jgi:hypothetical protein
MERSCSIPISWWPFEDPHICTQTFAEFTSDHQITEGFTAMDSGSNTPSVSEGFSSTIQSSPPVLHGSHSPVQNLGSNGITGRNSTIHPLYFTISRPDTPDSSSSTLIRHFNPPCNQNPGPKFVLCSMDYRLHQISMPPNATDHAAFQAFRQQYYSFIGIWRRYLSLKVLMRIHFVEVMPPR